MNQHLPPSNVRPLQWQPEDFKAAGVEQYILFAGKREPWISNSEAWDRATTIEEVSGGEYKDLLRIVAYSLEARTCRDATDDICDVVIERWAQDGKLLTQEQKEWVASRRGEAFANCFRLEECA